MKSTNINLVIVVQNLLCNNLKIKPLLQQTFYLESKIGLQDYLIAD